jgi:hypothetical protein
MDHWNSINYLSVSRQVNSLFQTEFSKKCDLELPPSTSSIGTRSMKFYMEVEYENIECGKFEVAYK